MKILLTGSSSFIGRNIKEYFENKYKLKYPSHRGLDLLNIENLKKYLIEHNFDIVINCAMYNKNFNHPDMLEHSLRMFYNLKSCSSLYKKMIYFGSGAEYGKQKDISFARESDIGKVVPYNYYGLAKYAINQSISDCDNILNLRLFGVYGKYEDYNSKFISNMILDSIYALPQVINQNSLFDYLYIDDFLKILEYFIENDTDYTDINVCSGQVIYLTDVAKYICEKYSSNKKIILKNDKTGFEYTGSNERLINIIGDFKFTDIFVAIDELYNWYKENIQTINYYKIKEKNNEY
ncbi:NAD-dependent epimerase/dehydratase family protein [Peptoanaerobacter stomatis]